MVFRSKAVYKADANLAFEGNEDRALKHFRNFSAPLSSPVTASFSASAILSMLFINCDLFS